MNVTFSMGAKWLRNPRKPITIEPNKNSMKIVYFIPQIVRLTEFGDFEEALALFKLLPPEDSSLRASKEQSIHIR